MTFPKRRNIKNIKKTHYLTFETFEIVDLFHVQFDELLAVASCLQFLQDGNGRLQLTEIRGVLEDVGLLPKNDEDCSAHFLFSLEIFVRWRFDLVNILAFDSADLPRPGEGQCTTDHCQHGLGGLASIGSSNFRVVEFVKHSNKEYKNMFT